MVDHLDPAEVLDAGGLSAEELKPGTRLGRYELLLAIAKGGMARVWAARQHGQRGFSKTVAIKTILPNLAEEPEFERMFLDEARIAALIHHPNVCEIYELGEEGKVLYLAMEWVNGESLFHILKSTGKMMPMDARLCARIVADACAGLHAAHVQTDEMGAPLNIVHRDVSPHNILISSDGNVKVADFGVAKALGQTHNATQAGQVKGKISYMSPEQIGGAQSDRRFDIFAMGVVLYEATTGRRPFTGEADPQIMQAILQGQFNPPSRVIRGYPPELEQIVLTAMNADPNRRYPTAERMRMALEEYLARSGPIVSQSHVGQFVQQRVGNVLDRRRDRIRAAANAPNPADISASGLPAVGGTPSAPRAVSGIQALPNTGMMQVQSQGADVTGPSIVAAMAQQPPSAGKYVLAAGIGVIIAAGLGIILILVMRSRAQPPVDTTSLAPTRPAVTLSAPAEHTAQPPASVVSAAPAVSAVELDLTDPTPKPTVNAQTTAAAPTTAQTTTAAATVTAPATTTATAAAASTATHRPTRIALPANPY